MTDFSTPEARAALVERVGIARYNRLYEAHRQASIVATVNGYDIRPVMTPFGKLYAVDGTRMAYRTLEEAKRAAMEDTTE